MRFRNRREAGEALARALGNIPPGECVVLALPRGGVPVAEPIARALDAPLDILPAKKIGHPSQPEYGIGAVTEDGHLVLNEPEAARLDSGWLKEAIANETRRAAADRLRYRTRRSPKLLSGKTVILVDDGVATGYTLLAAIRSVRSQGAARVIAAVPVGPSDTIERLREEADDVLCLESPKFGFAAVGAHYEDFSPVNENEVTDILSGAGA